MHLPCVFECLNCVQQCNKYCMHIMCLLQYKSIPSSYNILSDENNEPLLLMREQLTNRWCLFISMMWHFITCLLVNINLVPSSTITRNFNTQKKLPYFICLPMSLGFVYVSHFFFSGIITIAISSYILQFFFWPSSQWDTICFFLICLYCFYHKIISISSQSSTIDEC